MKLFKFKIYEDKSLNIKKVCSKINHSIQIIQCPFVLAPISTLFPVTVFLW